MLVVIVVAVVGVSGEYLVGVLDFVCSHGVLFCQYFCLVIKLTQFLLMLIDNCVIFIVEYVDLLQFYFVCVPVFWTEFVNVLLFFCYFEFG